MLEQISSIDYLVYCSTKPLISINKKTIIKGLYAYMDVQEVTCQ